MLAAIKSFFEEQLTSVEVGDDPEHLLRLATTALLIEISRADAEVVAAEESKILALVQRYFELPPEETQALIALADGHTDEAVSLKRTLGIPWLIDFAPSKKGLRDSAEMTPSFNGKPQATLGGKTQSPAACR